MEKPVLDKFDSALLKAVADLPDIPQGAFSLRKNGKSVMVNTTPNINIIRKTDKPGIDIYIRADTKDETVHIPVVITESGILKAEDVGLMRQHAVHAFLVGEAFMRAPSPGEELARLFF